MSIFYKNNDGQIKKIASHLIQKVNARWFLCTRVVEDGQEYYDIPEAEALLYFSKLSPFTIYALGFNEPNTTTSPKLRYKGEVYNIYDLTGVDPVQLEVGQLVGVYQMFTQESDNEKSIYFVGNTQAGTDNLEVALSRKLELGMNGIIEANRVVFTIEDADSYIKYRNNLREFILDGHLPIVLAPNTELDTSLQVAITFGNTTYYLYNYLFGANTPLTIGDLLSVATYDETTGYFFHFEAIFFENSDRVGFGIIPPALAAKQLDNIVEDTDTIVTNTSADGTKFSLHLAQSINNKLARTLVTPMTNPTNTEIVAVDNTGTQKMLTLGTGLYVENGELRATGGSETGGTIVTVNGEEQEVWNADTKLDKITTTTNMDQAYVKAADGSQKILNILPTPTAGSTGIPNLQFVNNYLVSKETFDGAVASLSGQNEYIGSYDGTEYTADTIQTVLSSFVQTVENRAARAGDIVNIVNGIYGGQQWIFSGDSSTWKYYIDFDNHSVINNLTSDSTTDGLAAAQGKVLKGFIDELSKRASLPIGAIIPSAIPLTTANVHLLDGSTIAQDGVYSDFVALLKTLVEQGYNVTCSNDEFDNEVAATGNCGKFVIDDTNNLIRLPKITKFIQGLTDLTNIGTSIEAGLPNITGRVDSIWLDSSDEPTSSDALTVGYGDTNYVGRSSQDGWAVSSLALNASNSNSIYGKSTTVQPAATQYPYYIVLANTYQTDIQIDIDNYINDLNILSSQVANCVTLDTAQEITGQKTFVANKTYDSRGTFILKNSAMNNKVVPTTNHYHTIAMLDNEDNRQALFEFAQRTDGNTDTKMTAFNYINGELKSASLQIQLKADGTAQAFAPTPSIDKNGTHIATTAYTRNLLQNFDTLKGTFVKQIPSGANLNDTQYLEPGVYQCATNNIAATLINAPAMTNSSGNLVPATSAFTMIVREVIGDKTAGETYVYRVREIIDWTMHTWTQQVYSTDTAGSFTFSAWNGYLCFHKFIYTGAPSSGSTITMSDSIERYNYIMLVYQTTESLWVNQIYPMWYIKAYYGRNYYLNGSNRDTSYQAKLQINDAWKIKVTTWNLSWLQVCGLY